MAWASGFGSNLGDRTMKRRTTPIIFAILLIASLLQNGCKTSDTVTSNTLTVTVSTGVVGNPVAGTYTHTLGDTVEYSYSLQEGYSGLKVLLDNVEVAASGTITISANHTLQAYTAGNGTFTLTVTVSTGVTGTPAAGTYTYKDGDVVDYSYSLESGYTGLNVSLDSVALASSGSITISKSQTLAASASKQFDVRGTWVLTETYNDGSSFKVSVTFTGDSTSGTTRDSDGGVGNYAVSSNIIVFTLVYPNVTYHYSGTLSTDTNMSGTSTRKNSAGNGYDGTWSAVRNATARIVSNPSSNKGSTTR